MHDGIEIVSLAGYANPHLVIRLAQAAEAAGWEGVLVAEYASYESVGASCSSEANPRSGGWRPSRRRVRCSLRRKARMES